MSKLMLISSVLLLTIAGSGCSGGGDGGSSPSSPTSSPAPSGGQVVTVELSEFAYTPKSITIEAGQTVRWILRGNDFTHTVTDRDGAWDSGFVFTRAGATFERTFTAQELGMTFNYSCQSHQGCCNMQGSIRVGTNAPDPIPGY